MGYYYYFAHVVEFS